MILMVVAILILTNLLFLQDNYNYKQEKQEYIKEEYSNIRNTNSTILKYKTELLPISNFLYQIQSTNMGILRIINSIKLFSDPIRTILIYS